MEQGIGSSIRKVLAFFTVIYDNFILAESAEIVVAPDGGGGAASDGESGLTGGTGKGSGGGTVVI